MIKDAPSGRSPETAMRDLLRQIERQATGYTPYRPAGPTVMAALSVPPPPEVRIGNWVLTQNDTGDLVAVNDDGTTRVVATQEVP